MKIEVDKKKFYSCSEEISDYARSETKAIDVIRNAIKYSAVKVLHRPHFYLIDYKLLFY